LKRKKDPKMSIRLANSQISDKPSAQRPHPIHSRHAGKRIIYLVSKKLQTIKVEKHTKTTTACAEITRATTRVFESACGF